MFEPLKALKRPRGLSAKAYKVSHEHVENAGWIAVISFHGRIPDGSRGQDHAEYLTLKSIELLTRLDAIAIVIDFRDVHYKWGNSLLRLFTSIEDHLFFRWHDMDTSVPIKLLASDKSIGLRSLVTNDALFFESVEDAIRACDADVKTWLDDYSD